MGTQGIPPSRRPPNSKGQPPASRPAHPVPKTGARPPAPSSKVRPPAPPATRSAPVRRSAPSAAAAREGGAPKRKFMEVSVQGWAFLGASVLLAGLGLLFGSLSVGRFLYNFKARGALNDLDARRWQAARDSGMAAYEKRPEEAGHMRMLAALAAVQAGDISAAEAIYTAPESASYPGPEPYVGLGVLALRKADAEPAENVEAIGAYLNQAADFFGRAEGRSTECLEAQVGKGLVKLLSGLKLGDRDDLAGAYQVLSRVYQAVESEPEKARRLSRSGFIDLYAGLGRAAAELALERNDAEQFQEASKYLKAAFLMDPTNSQLFAAIVVVEAEMLRFSPPPLDQLQTWRSRFERRLFGDIRPRASYASGGTASAILRSYFIYLHQVVLTYWSQGQGMRDAATTDFLDREAGMNIAATDLDFNIYWAAFASDFVAVNQAHRALTAYDRLVNHPLLTVDRAQLTPRMREVALYSLNNRTGVDWYTARLGDPVQPPVGNARMLLTTFMTELEAREGDARDEPNIQYRLWRNYALAAKKLGQDDVAQRSWARAVRVAPAEEAEDRARVERFLNPEAPR